MYIRKCNTHTHSHNRTKEFSSIVHKNCVCTLGKMKWQRGRGRRRELWNINGCYWFWKWNYYHHIHLFLNEFDRMQKRNGDNDAENEMKTKWDEKKTRTNRENVGKWHQKNHPIEIYKPFGKRFAKTWTIVCVFVFRFVCCCCHCCSLVHSIQLVLVCFALHGLIHFVNSFVYSICIWSNTYLQCEMQKIVFYYSVRVAGCMLQAFKRLASCNIIGFFPCLWPDVQFDLFHVRVHWNKASMVNIQFGRARRDSTHTHIHKAELTHWCFAFSLIYIYIVHGLCYQAKNQSIALSFIRIAVGFFSFIHSFTQFRSFISDAHFPLAFSLISSVENVQINSRLVILWLHHDNKFSLVGFRLPNKKKRKTTSSNNQTEICMQ